MNYDLEADKRHWKDAKAVCETAQEVGFYDRPADEVAIAVEVWRQEWLQKAQNRAVRRFEEKV